MRWIGCRPTEALYRDCLIHRFMVDQLGYIQWLLALDVEIKSFASAHCITRTKIGLSSISTCMMLMKSRYYLSLSISPSCVGVVKRVIEKMEAISRAIYAAISRAIFLRELSVYFHADFLVAAFYIHRMLTGDWPQRSKLREYST
ncbi:hypothetical protein GUJ93_ZPchr0012g19958 [Zizania palustris]|uniref:Uncharacterized protein n=1 Tax=Zizania palustris TaxID=103762 RepID=A0A8J5WMT9_ZIZPA|nr:hypothetical protein GUJ93_ZPchr0012g19958 [Zizania palustris]